MNKKELKRNYWKEEEELLLKGWADKAQCYQWMHSKSREIYQRKNAFYTIPVIIISTITGTANFAQDRFSEDVKPYATMTIGSLSILAGIITTISQFLKVSELNEGHRVAAFSWGKFYRDINAELVRHPLDRSRPDEFMKYCKEEYSRLVEISPYIPQKISVRFNSKFSKIEKLVKPELNVLKGTEIFEMDDTERGKMINAINKDIIKNNKKIEKNKIIKENKVNKFKQSFFNLNNRDPTNDEINQNLKYIDNDDIDNNNDTIKSSSSSSTSSALSVEFSNSNETIV